MLLDSVGYDLKDIKQKNPSQRTFIGEFFKNSLLVIFFSLFSFIVINLPAYYQIGVYRFSPSKAMFNFPTIEQMELAYASSLPLNHQKKTPEETVNPDPAQVITPPDITQYPDNTVFIPKIGVKAPIGWDIASDQISNELEKHVVHVAGSVKPGEKGNVFITGHSSNYWWKSGDFNTVFALLPEIKKDDQIILTYKGKFYYYKVTNTLEVKPSEVSRYFSSDASQLTIMTCTPVGTNLKRLLVFASPQQ